jgi:hypothetical protein
MAKNKFSLGVPPVAVKTEKKVFRCASLSSDLVLAELFVRDEKR